MLESESSALPFGDSPLRSTNDIIYKTLEKCKHFLKKIKVFLKTNFLPVFELQNKGDITTVMTIQTCRL